jgi:hypothetical protein
MAAFIAAFVRHQCGALQECRCRSNSAARLCPAAHHLWLAGLLRTDRGHFVGNGRTASAD